MNSEHFYSLDRPFHALPGKSQVKTANLSGLPNLVNKFGGNYRYILERHNIDPEQAGQAECFVDCQSVVDMFEYCARTFNDPLFGIQLAQQQQPDMYGCVTALCRAAPDFRQAIHCLIDYIPVIHSSESVLELVEGKNTAEFRWSERTNMGLNEQANYHGLVINLKVLRMLGGAGFVPDYVSFPRGMTSGPLANIEQVLGCEVRLASGKGCIAFPVRLLNLPVPSANQPLFQLLDGYMSRLKNSYRPDLVDKVKKIISDDMDSGDISIVKCAEKLGMSSRSLQLRLQAEGLSYAELRDRQRVNRARYILRNSNLPIADVADILGYAERTSFGRAFKRWTGYSPRQYRDQ